MINDLLVLGEDEIKSKIHTIRGIQVMLDSDLAELYHVPVKVLNQAVKRNMERFPENFMFQLTNIEYNSLRLKIKALNEEDLKFQNIVIIQGLNLRSQIVTSSWGGRTYLPFVFTEQGVAMLSGVLKSKTAVNVSVQIINAFIIMRKFISSNADIFHRLDKVEIKQRGELK